jgi:hypothetical protein
MWLQFLKEYQNTQKCFVDKEWLTARSPSRNCRETVPKSASVLSHFPATYSQKGLTAKHAKSNKNFNDEYLLYIFWHS